jgi:hypothetical protein
LLQIDTGAPASAAIGLLDLNVGDDGGLFVFSVMTDFKPRHAHRAENVDQRGQRALPSPRNSTGLPRASLYSLSIWNGDKTAWLPTSGKSIWRRFPEHGSRNGGPADAVFERFAGKGPALCALNFVLV